MDAVGEATDPVTGDPIQATGTDTVAASPSPALEVVLSDPVSTPEGMNATVTITNTGNVDLFNIVASLPPGAEIVLPPGVGSVEELLAELPQGESITFDIFVPGATPADELTVDAVGEATDPVTGQLIQVSDTISLPIPFSEPGIVLEIVSSQSMPDGTVVITYSVTSVGSHDIYDLLLEDTLSNSTLNFVSGDSNSDDVLNSDEVFIFTSSGPAPDSNEVIMATATGNALYLDGSTITVSDDVMETFGTSIPTVGVEIFIIDTLVMPNGTTTIVYGVINTGDLDLTDLIVNDPRPNTTIEYMSGDLDTNGITSPNEVFIFHATGPPILPNTPITASVTGTLIGEDGIEAPIQDLVVKDMEMASSSPSSSPTFSLAFSSTDSPTNSPTLASSFSTELFSTYAFCGNGPQTQCFTDFGFNKTGWTTELGINSLSCELYVGYNTCDPTSSTFIGTLNLDLATEIITVEIIDECQINSFDVFLGDEPLPFLPGGSFRKLSSKSSKKSSDSSDCNTDPPSSSSSSNSGKKSKKSNSSKSSKGKRLLDIDPIPDKSKKSSKSRTSKSSSSSSSKSSKSGSGKKWVSSVAGCSDSAPLYTVDPDFYGMNVMMTQPSPTVSVNLLQQGMTVDEGNFFIFHCIVSCSLCTDCTD